MVPSARKTTKRNKVCRLSKLYLGNNVNVNMNPDNLGGGGVFERRTSNGSEAFYLLNLCWYLSLPS